MVSPANLNGGAQVVIAGHKGAVDRACAAAKTRGAKRTIPLTVSAPFHCALMQPAALQLAEQLRRVEVASPKVPGDDQRRGRAQPGRGRVRELLTAQVTAPVRWEESVSRLAAMGITVAVEVGEGVVLAGLVRRIAPSIAVHAAGNPDQITALVASGVAGGKTAVQAQ